MIEPVVGNEFLSVSLSIAEFIKYGVTHKVCDFNNDWRESFLISTKFVHCVSSLAVSSLYVDKSHTNL